MIPQTLLYIGIGLLGIVLYTTFKSRDYIFKSEFNMSYMWRDNRRAWVWSVLMLVLLAITISLVPESSGAIKTMVGLDIAEERSSWLSLGFALSALTKNTIVRKEESYEQKK